MTSTELTFMSAIDPTAAKAVSPNHLPYPTSPRERIAIGTTASEQTIIEPIAR